MVTGKITSYKPVMTEKTAERFGGNFVLGMMGKIACERTKVEFGE